MAKIYYKTATDNTLLLEPREMVVRKINSGSGWTDLRIGIYAGCVVDTDDNSFPTATVDPVGLQNNFSNRMYLGLKSSGSAFPGTDGTMFIGTMSSGSVSTYKWNYNYPPYPSDLASNDQRLYGAGVSGSITYLGTNALTSFEIPDATSVAGTTSYSGMWGLRLVINNKGLSNQTVSLYHMTTRPSAPYTFSALRGHLSSLGQTSLGTVTWNDGVNAYPLPDHFFFYLPYSIMRARVSTIGAWVFSP
jgi:hypothetical protein